MNVQNWYIVRNLRGMPYAAGAVAAYTPLAISMVPGAGGPMLGLYLGTVGMLPRFLVHGMAGYTVALLDSDEHCGFLKGIAGGLMAEGALAIVAQA